MRLGKKVKAGLRTGLKVGAGILGMGAMAVGGYLGSKGSSTPSVVPSIAEIPSPAPIPQAPNRSVPRPVSQTRRDIDELKSKLSESTPTPKFRTPQQRASAIQSTDDFIAKYSKFYPDTRP